MELLCSPSCVIALSSFGTAQISTAFDMCRTPPNLEIKIKTSVNENTVSTLFTAGNRLETRQIGNKRFPLELKVRLHEQTLRNNRRSYLAKAYIWVPHTGERSYFMNGSVEVPSAGYCKYHHSSDNIVYLLQTFENEVVQVLPQYPFAKICRCAGDEDRLPVILEIEEDEVEESSVEVEMSDTAPTIDNISSTFTKCTTVTQLANKATNCFELATTTTINDSVGHSVSAERSSTKGYPLLKAHFNPEPVEL
uniref:ZP domain-containing protein n=1 Tax=Syphacia muris TaxID=451379 RepID=A0A0N5AIJ0_9BILA